MGQGPKKTVDSTGAEWPSPHPSSRRFDLYQEDPLTEISLDSGVNKWAESLLISAKEGVLASPYMRLGAFIALYNIRLEELREERGSRESSETRLEKALKMLPAIDPEKLRPSPDSLKQLKANILKDAQGEAWLRTRLFSLECADGFKIEEMLNG